MRHRSWAMRTAIAMLVFADPAAAADSTIHVENLHCDRGPFRLKLPASYKAVRKLAPIRTEKVLSTEQAGTHSVQDRLLDFGGLELVVVTFSNDPDRYMLSSAKLTSPVWTLAGRLRVGNTAKFAVRDFPPRNVPRDGKLSWIGEGDAIDVTVSAGRVKQIAYSCYTG